MVQIARSFSLLAALLVARTAVAFPHNLFKRQDQSVGQPQGTQGQDQGQGQNGQTGVPPPTGTLTGTLPPPGGTPTGADPTNVPTDAPATDAASNGANGSRAKKRQDSATLSFTDTAFPTDLPSGSLSLPSDLPDPSGSAFPSDAPAPAFNGTSGSAPAFPSGSDFSAFPQPSSVQGNGQPSADPSAAPSDFPSGSGFSNFPDPSGSFSDPPPAPSGTASDLTVPSASASA